MYALLPTVLQATFEQDAADHRGARMQDIDQQQRLLRADVNNLLEGFRAERATHGVRNHVAMIKFSDAEVKHMCSIMDLPEIQGLSYQDVVRNRSAPPVPPPALQQLLLDIEAGFPPRSGPCPWWCRHVCFNRDRFQMDALYRLDEQGCCSEVYLLLFAKKSPYEATCLKATLLSRSLPLVDGGVRGDDLPPAHRREFLFCQWCC